MFAHHPEIKTMEDKVIAWLSGKVYQKVAGEKCVIYSYGYSGYLGTIVKGMNNSADMRYVNKYVPIGNDLMSMEVSRNNHSKGLPYREASEAETDSMKKVYIEIKKLEKAGKLEYINIAQYDGAAVILKLKE